jgi:hypothetical protein
VVNFRDFLAIVLNRLSISSVPKIAHFDISLFTNRGQSIASAMSLMRAGLIDIQPIGAIAHQ